MGWLSLLVLSLLSTESTPVRTLLYLSRGWRRRVEVRRLRLPEVRVPNAALLLLGLRWLWCMLRCLLSLSLRRVQVRGEAVLGILVLLRMQMRLALQRLLLLLLLMVVRELLLLLLLRELVHRRGCRSTLRWCRWLDGWLGYGGRQRVLGLGHRLLLLLRDTLLEEARSNAERRVGCIGRDGGRRLGLVCLRRRDGRLLWLGCAGFWRRRAGYGRFWRRRVIPAKACQ